MIAAGDIFDVFAVKSVYPAQIIVAIDRIPDFERKPSVFNLTIQSNDTESPSLFGYFTLIITLLDVNEASIFLSCKAQQVAILLCLTAVTTACARRTGVAMRIRERRCHAAWAISLE